MWSQKECSPNGNRRIKAKVIGKISEYKEVWRYNTRIETESNACNGEKKNKEPNGRRCKTGWRSEKERLAENLEQRKEHNREVEWLEELERKQKNEHEGAIDRSEDG